MVSIQGASGGRKSDRKCDRSVYVLSPGNMLSSVAGVIGFT